MHFRFHNPGRLQARLLLGRECDVHLAGNRSRDFALQHENVVQVTLEALPPQDLARSALDQLGSNSHLAVHANDGAFDERVDAQLLRDRWYGFAGALVVHHGGARGHAEPANSGKIGDQLFRHALGEIFLVRLAGQIVERQHCDRSNLTGRWQRRRTQESFHHEPRDEPRNSSDQDRHRPSHALSRARSRHIAELGDAGQLVQQFVCGLPSLVRVLREAAAHEPLECRRYIRVKRRNGWRFTPKDGCTDGGRAVALKGPLSGQHFVENRSEREQIAARIRLLARELLWGHVAERSQDRAACDR